MHVFSPKSFESCFIRQIAVCMSIMYYKALVYLQVTVLIFLLFFASYVHNALFVWTAMSETIKLWSHDNADYTFYADTIKMFWEKKQGDIVPPDLDSL